jgi:hypothetical protein
LYSASGFAPAPDFDAFRAEGVAADFPLVFRAAGLAEDRAPVAEAAFRAGRLPGFAGRFAGALRLRGAPLALPLAARFVPGRDLARLVAMRRVVARSVPRGRHRGRLSGTFRHRRRSERGPAASLEPARSEPGPPPGLGE